MKNSLKLFLAATFLITPSLAIADKVLSCVDPDVAYTLLGNPGEGAIQISRQWPKQFPPVVVPDDFRLIGSRISRHYTLISFKSPIALKDTKLNIEATMRASEWQLPKPVRPGPAAGFQSSQNSPIRNSTAFCHDDHGYVTAMFSQASEGSSYITLLGSTQQTNFRCGGIESMMRSHFNPPAAMPLLSLPEGATGNSLAGGLIRSSGGITSTQTQLDSSKSSGELLDFFGAQLVNQEWSEEGSWIGSRVSGSAWISKDAKNSGLLRIEDQGNDRHKLEFEITQHR